MSRATKKPGGEIQGKDGGTVQCHPLPAPLKPNGVATRRSFDVEPISRVEWVLASTLHANDYNPNSVAPPERELLILSILEDGWTQPIVALPDGEIVDGFHRWRFSQDDPRLLDRYHGYIPVTRIIVDRVHQQMSTIRHNRARGTHGIKPTAKIVTTMLEAGMSARQLQKGLGMDEEEVTRLSTALGMPELAAKPSFSPAWKPGEKKEPA
jgi:hypothetical protein